MRLNAYIAQATSLSRRGADAAIEAGRVRVNSKIPQQGQQVSDADQLTLDGQAITPSVNSLKTVLFHKPAGYVCSRTGQGSRTIYELIPVPLHHLNPIGRLDKDSSGLLMLTNDGQLAQKLSHPSFEKVKIYEIKLAKPLEPLHQQMISDHGIQLEDGRSQLQLTRVGDDRTTWQITMHEGRNRQIRRTFESLGYNVAKLHRTQFGSYLLSDLKPGEVRLVE